MTKESALKCIENGRLDLVEHIYIKSLGYAGVSRSGQVVDCRKYPDAVPMQKNQLLDIPEPKSVDFIKMVLRDLQQKYPYGGGRLRLPILEPATIVQDRAEAPKESFLVPEMEFAFVRDEIYLDWRWQFVSDTRDIGVHKWIETLK